VAAPFFPGYDLEAVDDMQERWGLPKKAREEDEKILYLGRVMRSGTINHRTLFPSCRLERIQDSRGSS
jgi:hypothetical protein